MNIYDIDVTLLDAHCKHHISHAGPVGAHIHQLLEHHLTLWYQKTSPGPQNMLINALKFTFSSARIYVQTSWDIIFLCN